MSFSTLFVNDPYRLNQAEKEKFFLPEMNSLVQLHRERCSDYKKILDFFYPNKFSSKTLDQVPYLPVGLFKTRSLFSIAPDQIFKVLKSSGTTSSHPSKIYLDDATAGRQTAALVNIMTSLLGPQRLPMVIIDQPALFQDKHSYSAKSAALLGMLNFGRQFFYALDEHGRLNKEGLKEWLSKHHDETVLFYGLTSIVWQHFLTILEEKELDLPNGILIHSGGWKKMREQAVGADAYKKKLEDVAGIKRCHDFYGMVEQVGSIFIECEAGFFHAPQFAEIIIRHPKTWQSAEMGEEGVVQALSLLPTSYPGISLLTEDIGTIHGIDDCKCGRKGKYFKIKGRVPQAEMRGCSDTYSFASGAS